MIPRRTTSLTVLIIRTNQKLTDDTIRLCGYPPELHPAHFAGIDLTKVRLKKHSISETWIPEESESSSSKIPDQNAS
jgi:hypothetical protein